MKKILLIALLFAGYASSSFASDAFKVDNSAIDRLFAQSTDISLSGDDAALVSTFTSSDFSSVSLADEKTKTGFLVRSFFCGWMGMHRMYMGTGKDKIWWYYCIPVYGGILNCGDFWGTIFIKDQFAKYKDNPKKCVWMGN